MIHVECLLEKILGAELISCHWSLSILPENSRKSDWEKTSLSEKLN